MPGCLQPLHSATHSRSRSRLLRHAPRARNAQLLLLPLPLLVAVVSLHPVLCLELLASAAGASADSVVGQQCSGARAKS